MSARPAGCSPSTAAAAPFGEAETIPAPLFASGYLHAQPPATAVLAGVALLLRNVWVWLHHLLLSEPRRRGRELRLDKLRFRTMLQWLANFIEDLYGVVETADAYLPPLEKVRA